MRPVLALAIALELALITSAPAATPTAAPIAERRAHSETRHGVTLEDPYHWLKDQSYPKVDDQDVLDHLKAENAWFEAWYAPRKPFVDTLFAEMRARVKEDDATVPAKDGDHLYWSAFETGGQYRKHWRRPVAGGADQLILDEPAMATGKEYFRVGGASVSPNGKLLAYSVDENGAERFTLRVRDLATGVDSAPVSVETVGAPVWSADSRALVYTEVDANWRPYRARLHKLGRATDTTIYAEKDPAFFVGIGRTQDRAHVVVVTADHVTSEIRLVPTARPDAAPVVIAPRKTGRMYEVDAAGDTLFVRVNDEHINFRVATAPVARPAEWRTLVAGSDAVYILGLTSFRDHLVLKERVDGLDQLRLRRHDDASEHRIALPEASYTVDLGANAEYAPAQYRLAYQSMVSPATVYDYDPAARRLTTRKVQEIPSGYDAARYETRRIMAPARDGTLIPVSIVRRRGAPTDGTGRVHLYGYGAYGLAMTPSFSASRLSLVDRGVDFAIAHIRGGDELGYGWYLAGKAEKRNNTYTDFVDVAKHLAREGYAKQGQFTASGGSAGGNLMGVVANTDPGLWRAIVAHVPFVDMLNTMLDTSLPLTPTEWPEWGDPIKDPVAFRRILSFSPYENVRAQAYPPMLVTAGLNDPRVTYWEAAKWVARLRATKTDANPLLLKTNMGAGHGGKSGRFDRLRETAEEYAFILAAFDLDRP